VNVAVLNTGTATVKCALVEVDGARDKVRRRRTLAFEPGTRRSEVVREALETQRDDRADAIGHRVVHGGARYTAPTLIDDRLEAAIERVAPLAPMLNTTALEGIRIARELYPDRPMVAVFDTAFHAGRPLESLNYALPREVTESYAVYRYGFHGIAHESLAEALAAFQRHAVESVCAVTLQLGAGCSACAVDSGRSIETTMGFTPLEGLMCTTHSGTVDPGVILHLIRQGLSVDRIEELLTRRSGLLGCGGTADTRELLKREEEGDERAGLALRLFVRRIVTTAGAYFTLLGGRGSLVFGGGIGTRSPEIRRRIAAGLGAWDVQLDPSLNEDNPAGRISSPDARPTFVFDTDEEHLIARRTAEVVRANVEAPARS
jgi:acetate kinase